MEAKKQETQERSFEEALERVEAVVAELEEGKHPLGKLISLFEEGLTLSRACQKQLDGTERRLTELVEGTDGELKEKPLKLE
ncbi:exodeoxyribonuclease VII small subunit [bacterium]|nr:exodeoxyribonuclease VII small subunit [bacterium]